MFLSEQKNQNVASPEQFCSVRPALPLHLLLGFLFPSKSSSWISSAYGPSPSLYGRMMNSCKPYWGLQSKKKCKSCMTATLMWKSYAILTHGLLHRIALIAICYQRKFNSQSSELRTNVHVMLTTKVALAVRERCSLESRVCVCVFPRVQASMSTKSARGCSGSSACTSNSNAKNWGDRGTCGGWGRKKKRGIVAPAQFHDVKKLRCAG